MKTLRRRLVAVVLAAPVALVACGRTEGGSTAGPAVQATPATDTIAAVPLGDVAGASKIPPAAGMSNPFEGNRQAVQEGHDLFVRMNCAGCHGYDAKGSMGPDLTDRYWRYGGVPVAVFKSIYEGRPQGMPAWNPALPPDDIWKLVAYIESLGGTFAAPDSQGAVEGDRVGQNVAAETAPTLPDPRAPAEPASAASAARTVEARPDAGARP